MAGHQMGNLQGQGVGVVRLRRRVRKGAVPKDGATVCHAPHQGITGPSSLTCQHFEGGQAVLWLRDLKTDYVTDHTGSKVCISLSLAHWSLKVDLLPKATPGLPLLLASSHTLDGTGGSPHI